MEKWIILHMQYSHRLEKFLIQDLSDLAETDENDCLKVFNSLDEASAYQETHAINGQCVEIPTY